MYVEKSADVADISTAKLLLNKVETAKGKLGLTCADSKDMFYSYLTSEEGVMVHVQLLLLVVPFPEDVIQRNKLDLFLPPHEAHVWYGILARCDKHDLPSPARKQA